MSFVPDGDQFILFVSVELIMHSFCAKIHSFSSIVNHVPMGHSEDYPSLSMNKINFKVIKSKAAQNSWSETQATLVEVNASHQNIVQQRCFQDCNM